VFDLPSLEGWKAELTCEVAQRITVYVWCFSDQAEVMGLLLQSGAQVNAVNSSQCSALHIAVNKQHLRCIQVLLHYGCDVNVQVKFSDISFCIGFFL